MAQEKQNPGIKAASNQDKRQKAFKASGTQGDSAALASGAKPPLPEHKLGGKSQPLEFRRQNENGAQARHHQNKDGQNHYRGEGAHDEARDNSSHDDHSAPRQERRRAAPARKRFAANDDVPSIGGLIFALQQKPSNRPFVIAGIASVVWVALSAALIWSVFSTTFSQITSLSDLLYSIPAMSTVALVTIPIVLFWFLALLIWRAQELRLMSSAMTEVAVRLAEPDKAAEQSVASLGQSVRRQVTAMNDAISRALGRASELEAMVHNEVAALERSYNENEHRIRNLIGELAHERAALTKDGEKLSSSLGGLGNRLAKQIEHQGVETTKLLENTSENIAKSLIQSSDKVTSSMSKQSNSVVSTMTAMNERVGREMPLLLERMGKEQIKLGKVVEHANKNLSALDSSIGHHAGSLNNALTKRTQQIEGVFRRHVQVMGDTMDEHSQTLDNSLGNKLQTFDNTLHQRMEDFDEALSSTTQKIDTALANKAQYLDMAISSRVSELDSALIERTKVIDAHFTERLEALDSALHTSSKTLDQAFAHRAEELGRSMDARSQYIVQTIGAKTKELDNALMTGAKTLQLTTEDVGKKVMATIHGLAGQAQLLKDVSQGMQHHVSHLTSNLREQSNYVVQAAAQLENSHDRIGSKLGLSQNNLQKLVESISERTSDLDNLMATYSNQLESTLLVAERKAQEITDGLHTQSASQSMAALTELTKLRDAAASQTERAILDMKDRIASVSNEMSSQISTLSSEISDTQNHLKVQLQQIPDTTRKSALLMRRTLQDQLKALESLSSLSSNGAGNGDISAPHNGLPSDLTQISANEFPSTGQNFTPSGLGQETGSPLGMGGDLGQPAKTERDLEIEKITETLTKRVSEQMNLGGGALGGATPDQNSANHWSMGDLLARASEGDGQRQAGLTSEGAGAGATVDSLLGGQTAEQPSFGQAGPINIHAIAQLVDQSVAIDLWRTYRSGLKTPISESVYNDKGAAFRQINGLYGRDMTFRSNVDRYLGDFERILAESDKKDPAGNLATKHLTSEAGRVYLLLMHAAGRIGG